MIDPKYIFTIPFLVPFLYAETHYRFKYFFSWLKKPEPEIITDLPSRIKSGDRLPILIIVKDADKYPIELLSVTISNEQIFLSKNKPNVKISKSYFEKLLFIDTAPLENGYNQINVEIKYKIQNKINTCNNDNHRGTAHKPLPIYISSSDLPKLDGCIFGETHSHTNYTSDQLEFGASIKSTSILAKSMGLNFFCATDHSYDLDDLENNYLKNDPELKKWRKFLREVSDFNKNNKKICVIPGEEATLRNSRNKNIHCLIYNSEKFYPGSGDSGEKWLHPNSELSIKQVLDDVNEHTLVFAAHPVEPVPLLQRLLIRRDNWHEKDCKHSRLNGLQFANGGRKEYFLKGKKLWIKLLLKGYKLMGLAGNDAHGNFSRYRQVSFPFIKMKENYYNLFGVWRTGVHGDFIKLNSDSVLHELKAGNCFLTNGPALSFNAYSNNKLYKMGSTCLNISKLDITAKSSEEFGGIEKVLIFIGKIKATKEYLYYEQNLDQNVYDFKIKLPINKLSESGYFRIEILTSKDKTALSNPIWYNS